MSNSILDLKCSVTYNKDEDIYTEDYVLKIANQLADDGLLVKKFIGGVKYEKHNDLLVFTAKEYDGVSASRVAELITEEWESYCFKVISNNGLVNVVLPHNLKNTTTVEDKINKSFSKVLKH